MRLGQTMALSPKLIQSAEILQLNSMELGERLEQEVEKNVALELVMPGGADDDHRAQDDHREEAPQGGGSTEFERLRRMERQYGDQWNSDGDSRRAARSTGERDAKMDAMANAPSRGRSLVEELQEQWRFAEVHDPAIRTAGARLIDYIDDDGLLSADLETVREQSAQLPGCDWTLDTLRTALARIQQELEPRGVGAASVRDALLIQARANLEEETDLDRAESWGDAIDLLEKHYDDLLANRIPRIRDKMGLTNDRLERARACLKRLDPNPGRELVPPESTAIIPDVVVEYDPESGDYTARLADELMRLFATGALQWAMGRFDDDEAIEAKMVTKAIERAQTTVEQKNAEV
ncbi:MAG: hypothetical protein ACO3IB_04415, partial [Phycisphaerales bacterium]